MSKRTASTRPQLEGEHDTSFEGATWETTEQPCVYLWVPGGPIEGLAVLDCTDCR